MWAARVRSRVGRRPVALEHWRLPVTSTSPFTATVLGLPRIGPGRELKRAVEAYWAETVDAERLHDVGRELRAAQWTELVAAGLDSVPVGTFSHYDQMLDTAVLVGALPPRVHSIADPLDRYFAAARGTDAVEPLEMTKWFDTNYHYLVPELGPETAFELHPERLLGELAEAHALGVPARPVVIGPLTFLKLAKDSEGNALRRLSDLLPLYRELLRRLADAGAAWVQIDEPVLVTDLSEVELALVQHVYEELSATPERPALLVATYFGHPGAALPILAGTGIEGVALDFTAGTTVEEVTSVPALAGKLVVAGVVDGRNVWRTDPDRALATMGTLLGGTGALVVSTSSSLLHVPYSLEAETAVDPVLRSWLAFGAEKIAEVRLLATALHEGTAAVADELSAARTAVASRATDPRLRDDTVRARLAALGPDATRRTPAAERRASQRDRLPLPPLPTTTIGSYPQTPAIRRDRAALGKGTITPEQYRDRMRSEIAEIIALQEKLGLDVLVHGEPERNDMVQYFAEQLTGFLTTADGWVQSYGTRCVRPPILYGDVSRPHPMTVDWITYAQSLTDKPVKGMLTGPVTILAWSFVRDDQPLSVTADQVALAIRDETVDLQAAGIRIIQVDEPALRELLPPRSDAKASYLAWSITAFRLSTSGVSDATQIHTHLCYSEFGEVIDAIAALDADVTSIEAARSHMEVLDDLNAAGFALGVGPGVYDIHSPRVPAIAEITESLREALKTVPAERLWVNPDCGLKTRGPQEVAASLHNMVQAAHALR
ncbi:5-methyltetrahydropteroyltriglutamate--homocysteine S-methyltransferase [Nocardia seriolae]|uniref:5-methyltetrahydropteroyltriglutamate-- homocysteine S-methyltransferase n=1 Tax=Nocardia seriolae TaxID=37332 RepID=UPI000CD7E064|nr:5-methyltetrahydropteroyltriglutamate--homocysteine S-methyltransferase [Nocardia seriolae]PSK33270.1 5-methyltetrahydropteroyltriglutamate--homocysteine S-methyltransferase [Nocardia seriolae]QOW30531.1 5-methyltetrahydropteroyltriglutamate--homocysteine S-methyltransferase [Nocardia seriolae]QUN15546.1 5-methyltetrahydropteroyltriglutamate--homocysteine S-methyltransferase [Nocardia seriolae]WNJ57445.1 5-methyltetrahydropteroyltriglutamate--homocysteine S-methyltransferase [Nocardia seriol